LAGKTATLTFWAKADASKNIAVNIRQNFGTGGSPSAAVDTTGGLRALTTAWQKFSFTVAIPSISGKTLGSDTNDSLNVEFWFDAGSDFNTRASSLGQQSGTFDIAHVSIVEGDATTESDPVSPRHPQQELALCQRYFRKSYLPEVTPGTVTSSGSRAFYAPATAGEVSGSIELGVPMRATPSSILYSPATGASGNIRNLSSNADEAAGFTNNGNASLGFITGSRTSGHIYNFHYTCDAEL
jgi:hypothetical protein